MKIVMWFLNILGWVLFVLAIAFMLYVIGWLDWVSVVMQWYVDMPCTCEAIK